MRKTILGGMMVLVAFTMGGFLNAADTDYEMKSMKPDLDNTESLQRGLRHYVDYCMGCHSLQYQRYERTADDLNVPHTMMFNQKLINTGQAIGGYMTTAMSKEDAKTWFGAAPPDLTMVTRVRSPKWVYNFLTTFYIDESRPFGVNNKVFPNVGMPHVLLPLQGIAIENCYGYEAADVLDLQSYFAEARREGVQELDRLQRAEENCPDVQTIPGSGSMTAEQFDQAAYDIANFLHYMGDPSRQTRTQLGFYVLAFLFILLILAYFLNKEYWKDVPKSPKPEPEHHSTEY